MDSVLSLAIQHLLARTLSYSSSVLPLSQSQLLDKLTNYQTLREWIFGPFKIPYILSRAFLKKCVNLKKKAKTIQRNWRRWWHPTPVLLPGKFHGRRSLVAAVHGVTKSRTRLNDFIFTFHFHALEKEMATHSSVPAWRIPGKGEPGGLLSMGLHRVGHDWSNLAAAAAYKETDKNLKTLKCPTICGKDERASGSLTAHLMHLHSQASLLIHSK